MSSTSFKSRRSCIERNAAISFACSVIGMSSRNLAHWVRENTRYGLYCSCSARISMSTPYALGLIALARRLFFQPRHCRTLRQSRFYILERYAARFQKHQQVKQQVGAFGDQMIAIVFHRGDNGFHRLFAELLGAMFRTLVQQLARIGRLCSRCRAGIDSGGEIMEGETRHRNPTQQMWRRPIAAYSAI